MKVTEVCDDRLKRSMKDQGVYILILDWKPAVPSGFK